MRFLMITVMVMTSITTSFADNDCWDFGMYPADRTRLSLISDSPKCLDNKLIPRYATALEISHVKKFTTLPEGLFRGIENLTEVNIFDTQLTSVPEGLFRGLVNLQSVTIAQSPITSVPEGLLSGLVNLNTVDFSQNQLSSLPEGIFRGLSKLKML